jgi:hypothetical protein
MRIFAVTGLFIPTRQNNFRFAIFICSKVTSDSIVTLFLDIFTERLATYRAEYKDVPTSLRHCMVTRNVAISELHLTVTLPSLMLSGKGFTTLFMYFSPKIECSFASVL